MNLLSQMNPVYLFLGLAVLTLILLILVIVQMVQLGKLKTRYGKFMRGKDGKSLEKDVIALYQDNN